jgi:hypothetical protein
MESDFDFESVSPSGGGRGSLRGRLSGFFSIDSTSRIDRGRDGACSFIFNSSAPGIDRGTEREGQGQRECLTSSQLQHQVEREGLGQREREREVQGPSLT